MLYPPPDTFKFCREISQLRDELGERAERFVVLNIMLRPIDGNLKYVKALVVADKAFAHFEKMAYQKFSDFPLQELIPLMVATHATYFHYTLPQKFSNLIYEPTVIPVKKNSQ